MITLFQTTSREDLGVDARLLHYYYCDSRNPEQWCERAYTQVGYSLLVSLIF